MLSIHVKILGLVQGVFFRASTQEQARQLNINGWVKNCLDGSVEALFEGNEAQIDRMLAWCEEGPPHARVEQVDILESKDCTNSQEGFNIIHE